MKRILFLIAALLPLGAHAERICYFTFNNLKEYETSNNFIQKVNQGAGTNIEVVEFLTEGDDPKVAFEAMVKSGVQCDGLVISGHHVGNWEGHRARGVLKLDDMEKLSCDPKYAGWFRNLAAISLEGCRTVGVGDIVPDDPLTTADFNTLRVGEELEADGMEQDYTSLNMEFSNVLDQDNPLASRYLRLFPEATLFGWTKSAPGEKTNAHLSMLYHMAQMSRILKGGEFTKQAPTAEEFSPKTAAEYANAVLFTLKKFGADQRECEELKVDAWLAHGNVGYPGKYFFDNPDLLAFPSLASSGDESLVRAREIDCMIKNAIREKNTKKLNQAMDLIGENQDYLRFSLNTLIDLRKELLRNGGSNAETILQKMREMPGIRKLLLSKLRSDQTGTIRKIDYYRFFRDLTEKRDLELEEAITNSVVEMLKHPLPALDMNAETPDRSRNNAMSYRATMFQSLVKNGMHTDSFYDDLLAHDPEADVLMSMVNQAPRVKEEDAIEWMLKIAESPKANKYVGKTIVKKMIEMGVPGKKIKAYAKRFEHLKNVNENAPIKAKRVEGETPTLPGLY